MLQNQEKVRFGVYIADLHTSELRRGQDTIPVQNLPFRILALLLREPGRVVTRDEIRQELWPADTFVDYERGISTAVSKLREALGDSAGNPRFIETVGRRGYRFIAPVTVVPSAQTVSRALAAAQPALEPATEGNLRMPAPLLEKPALETSIRKRAAFVGFTAIFLALAVLAFDWIGRQPSPKVSKMLQLTASGRIEPAGNLHTDGSRLFFIERSGPLWSLMQTSVAGGDIVPVQAPFPQTILLGISPDHTLMLVTKRGGYGERNPVSIVPIQGGIPQRAGDVVVDQATWFPDGQRLLCSLGHEVFSVDRDGTHRRHLFNVDGQPFKFAWRPDGASFRFSVGQDDDSRSLWEASADGSNLHPLLTGWNEPPNECCGIWSPDGRSFVFTSIQGSQEDLWVLHDSPSWPWHSAPNAVRLTNGPTSFSDPVFSSDGKTIFATGIQAQAYGARFDPQSRKFSRTSYAFDFTFSHDGKWMAYIADPGATLWRSRPDGSEKVRLTVPPLVALSPRWSPDGKTILFMGRRQIGPYSVYTVPAEGGQPEVVYENKTNLLRHADWSPDQQSLIIDADSAPGSQTALTRLTLATHTAFEFPGSKGLIYPRWSPHGDYLAAVSEDLKHVVLFDVQSQTWKSVATVALVKNIEWEQDGAHLLYQDFRAPMQTLFRLEPASNKIEQVADCSTFLHDGATWCRFDGASPDGALMFLVYASYANLYALELDLR